MSSDRKLQHALAYADLGFRVLPCHSVKNGRCTCGNSACGSPGKHPRTFDGVHGATTNTTTINDWWTRHPDANPAIATGADLVVVDVDPRRGGDETLAELESKFGSLPKDFVVLSGGGGRHFYLSLPENAPANTVKRWARKGVELLGDGAYVVAPPSNHVSGGVYQWPTGGLRLSPLPPMPPGWRAAWPKPAIIGASSMADRRDRSAHTTDKTDSSFTASLSVVHGWSPEVCQQVADAVRVSVVIAPGTRNHQLVGLGRRLFRIRQLQLLDLEDTEPIFDEWFTRSYAIMQTKDRRVSWKEWVYIWTEWVDPSLAQKSIEQMFENAKRGPMPAIAEKYRSKKLRLLIQLCRHLEVNSGGAWFLSCRKAAKLLEVDFMVANSWLRKLVKDRVLERVGDHTKGSMKAQRYRYRGDDLKFAPGAV